MPARNLGSQDFMLPFAGASATAHKFTRQGLGTIEPRQPKMLGRLALLDVGPGLVTKLAVSGHQLLLGDGFPAAALRPGSITDRHNVLGCAAGPNSPLELVVEYTNAAKLSGYVGTDPVDPALLEDVLDAMEAGRLFGPGNWGWGLGEKSIAAAGGTGKWSVRVPREANLGRLVVCVYDGGQPVNVVGDCMLQQFDIAGNDMLARSGDLDALLLDPSNSDEDGLNVGEFVTSSDLVELEFVNNHAANAYTVQVGFWTD